MIASHVIAEPCLSNMIVEHTLGNMIASHVIAEPTLGKMTTCNPPSWGVEQITIITRG